MFIALAYLQMVVWNNLSKSDPMKSNKDLVVCCCLLTHTPGCFFFIKTWWSLKIKQKKAIKWVMMCKQSHKHSWLCRNCIEMILFQGVLCMVQKADIYFRNLEEMDRSDPQRMELLFCEEKTWKQVFSSSGGLLCFLNTV